MSGTVINNSQSTIQIYTTRTNDTSNFKPTLQSLKHQTPVVASESNSDISFLGDGDYIYCGVWDINTVSGSADSWIIFSINSGTVVNSNFDSYSITVSGTRNTNFVITVSDGSGNSTPSNNVILVAFIVIIALLVLAGIGAGIFFLLKTLPKGSANPYQQTDLPVFIG